MLPSESNTRLKKRIVDKSFIHFSMNQLEQYEINLVEIRDLEIQSHIRTYVAWTSLADHIPFWRHV